MMAINVTVGGIIIGAIDLLLLILLVLTVGIFIYCKKKVQSIHNTALGK